MSLNPRLPFFSSSFHFQQRRYMDQRRKETQEVSNGFDFDYRVSLFRSMERIEPERIPITEPQLQVLILGSGP